MRKRKWARLLCLLLSVLFCCGCASPKPQQPTEGVFTPIGTDPAGTELPTEETAPPPITVTTFEALAALAEGDALEPGDTVCLAADMEITAPVVFTVPVDLNIAAQIVFTYPISFVTWDTGTVRITLEEGVGGELLDLRFNAPNCDLYWMEPPYASAEAAAEAVNVRSFNDMDLRTLFGMGGTGKTELTAVTMEPADNGALDTALNWYQDGNVFYLAVSYLTADSTLENAAVHLTLSDGTELTETVDLTAGPYYHTVTDENGETRIYKIVTERITYNLPVVYIEIENGAEVYSRDYYLSATISIDSSNAVGDFPSLETTAIQIRGRGHYTWNFAKKPYKIRFSSKTSVLGMNASKNWVLLANYLDRSLLQNYVALEMGKVMTGIPYHSTQYPVDVFVNGSYRGVYTIGEQIEAKEERIDLEESYTEVDTDYLLEVGGSDDGDVNGVDYFHAGTLRYVAVKHPDTAQMTAEQMAFLTDYVTAADNAVKNLTNYEDYIDVDSLIDWVIIHELTYNLDCCFRRSCYLIKEAGGKLKMGPIWDFDLAFGSFYRYQSGDWATIGESGGYVGITWMNYLRSDPAFMARLTARWNEVKETLLEEGLTSMDTMSELTAPSAEMNFQVWDVLGKSLSAQPWYHAQYDTYEKMTSRLRTWLIDRYNWLDHQLNGS